MTSSLRETIFGLGSPDPDPRSTLGEPRPDLRSVLNPYRGSRHPYSVGAKSKKKQSQGIVRIIDVHNDIISHLNFPTIYSSPESFTPFLSEIKKLKWLSTHSEDRSMRLQSLERLRKLREILTDLEEGFALGWYLLKSHNLSCLTSQATAPSLVPRKTHPTGPVDQETRAQDNLAFLLLVSEFSFIPPSTQGKSSGPTTSTQCVECGNAECLEPLDNGEVCTQCGVFTELVFCKKTDSELEDKICTTPRTQEQDVHFIDAMKDFQGKQNTTIKQCVYDHIRGEMKLQSITKSQLTKAHIHHFLEGRYSSHYNDVHLIHSQITGMACIDLSEVEDILISLNTKIEEAYLRTVKGRITKRKSSINVWFKLYKLLQLLGIDVKRDEFFFLRTPGKYSEHMTMWEAVCKYNTWRYINY
jgi:Poxvirus Late Transcription Factor VLTF3 like